MRTQLVGNSIVGVVDAVDRIEFEASIKGLGFANVRLLGFDGELGFYRKEVNSPPARNKRFGRLLAARWLSGTDSVQHNAVQVCRYKFAADLPVGALARIERFRDGGQLYLQLDGSFSYHIIVQLPPDATCPAGRCSVRCESLAVPRDQWNTVVGELRRELRFALDIAIPAHKLPSEKIAQDLVARHREAQHAYDNGDYDNVARIVYMMVELLKAHPEGVQRRYGERPYKLLANLCQALRSVANGARHEGNNSVIRMDRPLATMLLASAQAMTGVWFAGDLIPYS